jgi:hypothetical protein
MKFIQISNQGLNTFTIGIRSNNRFDKSKHSVSAFVIELSPVNESVFFVGHSTLPTI